MQSRSPTKSNYSIASQGGRGSSRGTNIQIDTPRTNAHITTVGVKRPGYGTVGRPIPIFVNSFVTTIPDCVIHHYDAIKPSDNTLPATVNMRLIQELQVEVEPELFTPRAVYDGRKNIYAIRELPFEDGCREFEVQLPNNPAQKSSRSPKVYKVCLTKVAEINPEVLKRYIAGLQSQENTVLTAITALNVVVRMEPSMNYPFNVRSFFTSSETKDIGAGVQLWRGYFQSVRPAIGRMLINIDISTAAMYKGGPLLGLCLEFVGKNDPNVLSPNRGFPDRERLRLQRFISGIRVTTAHFIQGGAASNVARVVKKLSSAGANSLIFTMREGGKMSVADYFKSTQSRSLRYPDVICVEVGSGALVPLELCMVPPGQIMRKQVPSEKIKDVLDFATKKPKDRLDSIKKGLRVLSYGKSEYVRQFGMNVDLAAGPLKIQARVLKPPVMRYGPGSAHLTITPNNGSWSMVDKRFYVPCKINLWAIVIYEHPNRFNRTSAGELMKGLVSECQKVGIKIQDTPYVEWKNGLGNVSDQLRSVGRVIYEKHKATPNLIVVVLPEGGNDIYTAVKHFGDVTVGVATQCMKSSKCFRARPSYFANLSLKINVKLGGINTIPDMSSMSILADQRNPTIIMGADVIHPAPGTDGRPSFTAVVANVDHGAAKYIADCRIQTSRKEMIEDLQVMTKNLLGQYREYRIKVEKAKVINPSRMIFYRDGVSEGQFKTVLDEELPLIRKACEELKIKPKITLIIVGKRHHVRFFPQDERDADKSGNCQAGTVVDREISHPTEFDFYLQSHGGILGTSRPAHYSVLVDENNLSADVLQSLSFTLCHVYARSTRSVSIPAPVYYADIVCSRARNHYDPQGGFDFSEGGNVETGQTSSTLDIYRRGFKELHKLQRHHMYFS